MYRYNLVVKEFIAEADAMSPLYANILFQLALFNHAASLLNDSQISQSRNGRIISTCQQGALISHREKCRRKHINLSQEFFNLSSLPNVFSLHAYKPL